jgi:hypothetical protein
MQSNLHSNSANFFIVLDLALVIKWKKYLHVCHIPKAGNTKGGSITVLLTSSLTGLD